MEHLCRILIIDDESILRHGLKHLCNWEDEQFCIVGEASNGEEALQMIQKVKPHIIITDVVMPVMDGVEFSKTVHSLYPDIKVIILSSFSEFNYVKETFKHGASDYLLKATLTASNLLTILKKVRTETTWESYDHPKLENVINLDNILYNFINKATLKENSEMDLLRNHFNKMYFMIIMCNLDFLEHSQDTSVNAFEKSIAKLSKCYLSSYTYANIFSENNSILIINFDDIELVKADISKFTHNLKICFPPTVFISSDSFIGLENIPKLHTRVTELLPKTFYFHHDPLVYATTLSKSSYTKPFDLNLFITNIKSLNFERAYEVLKIYFKEIKVNLSLDDYSLKRFCQNVIYSTLNTCDELGFDILEISNSKIRLFKTIDMAISFYELERIVFDILDKISHSISLQAEQKNSIMITQIKRYVDENYSNDISLTEISEKLHINYYYMSSYFKTHTNENLSTYINKVRVEKAKLLLSNKTIPISHISEMVGFSEHNYFSKVFKKHTKLTPTAYRRKVLG